MKLEHCTSLIKRDVDVLRDGVVEVRTRLQNGREVFADHDSRITALEPKAPDWVKLLMAALSLVGVLVAAQVWLQNKFDDRPTNAEFEKAMAPTKMVQEENSRKISDIREEQAAQREILKSLKESADILIKRSQ